LIQQVIVVEGKSDVAAIRRAVEADCLVTGGFSLSDRLMSQIEAAYHRRGIIILTDPDSAGERIRIHLQKRFPAAGHAFVSCSEATGADGRIGVEKASAADIRSALDKVRLAEIEMGQEFAFAELLADGLSGGAVSVKKRAFMGAELGIGWANAKTFLHRLNSYGVSRQEYQAALDKWEAANE
jgi:ribonuclease M5